MVRAWVLGGFALLSGAVSAVLAEPPSETTSNSLPQVTIQAQREAVQEEARQFVGKVTGSSWASSDDRPLDLWRVPVCLAVAGLHRPQGEFIFNRVTQTMNEAGVKSAKNGCTPNLIIVVTTQPEVLLSAWRKRDKRMFGAATPSEVKQFFNGTQPVRIWYNTSVTGEDGDLGSASSSLSAGAVTSGGGGAGGGGMSGESGGGASSNQMLAEIPTFKKYDGGSRLQLTGVPDLTSVIVIVDFKQCEGFDWGALTDYIAMAALTNIDLHTNFSDLPSILGLFGAPADRRQASLTDWDHAYLKALYHTDRMSKVQRVKIREQMVREMDPVKTATR